MEKTHPNDYRYDKSGNEILERYFGRLAVEQLLKSVQGSMLTLIESTMSDKEQRNAVKNLVKQEFSRRLDDVYETAMKDAWVPMDSDIKTDTHQAYGCILHLYDTGNVISQE